MGEAILQTDIKRDPQFLYYVSTNKKDGTLMLCKAKLARGGGKKKKEKKE